MILLWNPEWGYAKIHRQDGFAAGLCTVTYNQSRVSEARAVVIHFTDVTRELLEWENKTRNPDQFFVFWSVEAPSYLQYYNTKAKWYKDDHFFNWTMTYRRDSDIFAPYLEAGVARDIFSRRLKDTGAAVGVVSIIVYKPNKHIFQLWLVSNCNVLYGSVERMKYVDKLIEAGLPVERFGKCFNNAAEFNDLSLDRLASYKFYLAFENALHCKDYVSEKFWQNGIQSWRVPVVWGARKEDLLRLVPENSFIHADDYETAADLAEYLIYLDNNTTAYTEYFNWFGSNYTTEYLATLYERTAETLLCDKLLAKPEPKIIPSVKENIFSSESEDCLKEKTLYHVRY
uniref:Fucosyltransferase n=1 Tax=Ciona intestinalis TaxID=7719 RepID=F6U9D6_CIOIN